MRKIIGCFFVLLALSISHTSYCASTLDYSKMIILDAEDLAESGIKGAYEKLKPLLKVYVKKPAQMIEIIDSELSTYRVRSRGITYDIYSPTLHSRRGESWGRATVALFAVVNSQLNTTSVKFYAINSGNDLGGMFLTKRQVAEAKKSLKRKTDWPYIPTLQYPWYGQQH